VRERLDLQPLDGLADDLLIMIRDHLEEETGLTVRIVRDRPVPAPMDPIRHQYNADLIIDRLAARHWSKDACVLAVTGEDIYASGMNFVFGLADAPRGVGVVSMARLASTSLSIMEQRLVKEALHEAGHVLGLPHCENACVMRFSLSLRAVDAKPPTLCATCRSRLRAYTEAGPR
jgi:archaemetzincin